MPGMFRDSFCSNNPFAGQIRATLVLSTAESILSRVQHVTEHSVHGVNRQPGWQYLLPLLQYAVVYKFISEKSEDTSKSSVKGSYHASIRSRSMSGGSHFGLLPEHSRQIYIYIHSLIHGHQKGATKPTQLVAGRAVPVPRLSVSLKIMDQGVPIRAVVIYPAFAPGRLVHPGARPFRRRCGRIRGGQTHILDSTR
jgi:hypothetical protein